MYKTALLVVIFLIFSCGGGSGSNGGGDLTQDAINEISTGKTLVDADVAEQHMQDTINNDKIYIIGFHQLSKSESGIHTLSTVSTGFFEIEMQTGTCFEVSCCQLSVSGEGNMQKVVEDDESFCKINYTK
ncbi:MAG: hypothetical protein Rsou_2023 [Candidatus Ruthia sp. Asou_11_S2]|nr:hypothetical protein [Candidatus Ruthia sp. Asou_11_S2]